MIFKFGVDKTLTTFKRTMLKGLSGCPHRFHKKSPGHFQDKMKKFQDKTTSLNVTGQHM